MAPSNPVRFVRNVLGAISEAWNRVQIEDAGGNLIDAQNPLPIASVIRIPLIYNITLTLANTEYATLLPPHCQGFEFQARTEADVRFAFETGHVAAPVAPYETLKAGDYYYSYPLNQGLTPSDLFFASPTAGTVVELIGWI